MVLTSTQQQALDRAVQLAALGAGTVLPNPVVGCVLLSRDGTVVGEGWHERAGGPHAEIHALRAAGAAAAGATAVVTLEPCNHTGRTGPCSEALIAAGVGKVIVAVRDPWSTAAGGIERLRQAGVEVVDLSGEASPGRDAALDVNRVWLTAVTHGRPYVTFKAGMSIDGRVAAPDGTSRWITSPQARAEVHVLRGQVDTMLVGVGTVLADDPWLTVRDERGALTGRQPLRVVLDSAGRTPARARVRDTAAETLIATAAEFGDGERVDPARVLEDLFRRGRRHVLVEGGPRVAGSLLRAGLVDEMLCYVAPLVLGAGPPVVHDDLVRTLAQARPAQVREVRRVGPDVLVRYGFGAPSAGSGEG